MGTIARMAITDFHKSFDNSRWRMDEIPDGGKASGHCSPLYLVSSDFAPVKKLKKKHLCYFGLKNKCFDVLPVISFG